MATVVRRFYSLRRSTIPLSRRLFSSEPTESKPVNTKVNFSLPGYVSDSDSESENRPSKADLPPPYDPFSKKVRTEEPEDPKNLQKVFHRLRSGRGLDEYAVKMFDGLSRDGLTHEALELFRIIKDKGHLPDVVAHTAVIEAYASAGGHSKEALRTFLGMLARGVAPNAYTYAVLLKGLAGDGNLKDAKKYLVEMVGKGMRPNAATCVAVFEAFARDGKADEARVLLEELKGKGFEPDEHDIREIFKSKRGPVHRTVMDILFRKIMIILHTLVGDFLQVTCTCNFGQNRDETNQTSWNVLERIVKFNYDALWIGDSSPFGIATVARNDKSHG